MEITKVCSDCEGIEPPCCECSMLSHCCHACYLFASTRHFPQTVFEDIVDADISNPPDEVTWMPI